ncbi:hypothetical protein [Treponema putidum]|uniref:Uncharacterized protein n=1 Tax=Treponema putidum TaxID=221027 RepID=A0ABY5I0H8_9SPIR|nr:hypothetical protein [Treponema putidum]UTY29882.1 hypothetical protein E4N76_13590 [Treponema putidum]UTY32335.1 hypothetical protein E4N75_13355 [Treponema putidum]
MSDLKLTLFKKWEFDNEFSYVYGSVLLADGTAVILTSENTDWKKYCAIILFPGGIKKIQIDYAKTSNRDYPVLFRSGNGFGIIISAKEVRYYTGDFSSHEIIPIKNKPSFLMRGIIPEKAEQRYFQNISDSMTIPVCFENEVYYGDARNFALLEFDAAAKRAEWKSFSNIDKKAFTHRDDTTDETPKIDSLKIANRDIYAFLSGESTTSVNKWGMDYYALAKISAGGKVVEKLIESEDLKIGGKKRGVNGMFTNSDYVVMTPLFKTDDWKGKQKFFSLTAREYFDISLPRGMSKHKVQNISQDSCITSLYDRGLKEVALCKIG